MTDFYEVLKLDAGSDIQQLQDQLIRQESIWTDRASTRPEKATEMLAVIAQAKKAFASGQTKAEYDRQLAESKHPKADTSREEEFARWRQAALDYYSGGQPDLAKTALEKALPLSREDDPHFQALAFLIYKANGQYQTALDHINKAIVYAPGEPCLYIDKASVLELLAESSHESRCILQARETLRIASQKAMESSNQELEAKADGALARLLYFYDPKDVNEAKRLATRAMEHGDPGGTARQVLEDMANRESAVRRANELEQQRRRELEARKAQEAQARQQAQMQQQQIQQAMAAKKQQAKTLYLYGWILMAVACLFDFLAGGTGLAMIALILTFGGAGLLNYADLFKNGYDSTAVKAVSVLAGVVICFKMATAAYMAMGYSASSASRTWIIFIVLLVVYFVMIMIAKSMGRKARS